MTPFFNLPNRDVQLVELRSRYLWARGTQITGAATLTLGPLVWSGADPSSFNEVMSFLSDNVFEPIGSIANTIFEASKDVFRATGIR